MAKVLKMKAKPITWAGAVTLRNVGKMSNYERLRLSNWLREQADFIQRQGPELAPCYRARYGA